MKKRTLVSMVTVAMVTSTLVFGCGARGSESSSENAGNAAEGVSRGCDRECAGRCGRERAGGDGREYR